jgi:hypothetical protein
MIEVITKEKDEEEIVEKYPIIRESKYTNLIVLFTDEHSGIILKFDKDDPDYIVGEIRNDWVPDVFEDITEDVIIRNKQ